MLDDVDENDELVDEPDEDEIDPELVDDDLDDVDAADDGDDDEDDDDDAVPARRGAAAEDDEDEADPDDVEEDLDTILKDKIASGEDLDEDEEEDEQKPAPAAKNPDTPEGVTAKQAGEFTCNTCFMIVHPRQFGSKASPTCPEGYDDCQGIAHMQKIWG